MRPSDVLDALHDLHARLADPQGRYAQWFVSCMRLGFGGDYSLASNRNAQQFGAQVVRALPVALQVGYAYHVTEDMCDVLLAAAASLDSTDRANRDLAPTPAGFVRLDKPLPFNDLRGHQKLINYMAWMPGQQERTGRSATILVLWNDIDSTPDGYWQQWTAEVGDDGKMAGMREWMGRWNLAGLEAMPDGERIGDVEMMPDETVLEELNERLAETDHEPALTEIIPITNTFRYLHALWLLLGQTITDVRTTEVDRHTRRRMARVDMPQRVVVVELRRRRTPPSLSPGEPHPVNWSRQWMVMAHWRWQPHGPRKNVDHEHEYSEEEIIEQGVAIRPCLVPGCECQVERTLIHEYVKGPAGKPLFISNKVFDLRR